MDGRDLGLNAPGASHLFPPSMVCPYPSPRRSFTPLSFARLAICLLKAEPGQVTITTPQEYNPSKTGSSEVCATRRNRFGCSGLSHRSLASSRPKAGHAPSLLWHTPVSCAATRIVLLTPALHYVELVLHQKGYLNKRFPTPSSPAAGEGVVSVEGTQVGGRDERIVAELIFLLPPPLLAPGPLLS